MMSPGHYLHLRRNAAGLSVLATASALVGLPAALRRATTREINRMAERLHAAEADTAPLTPEQIRLVAEVVPIEIRTYLWLVYTRVFGIAANVRICTGCGCTQAMACVDRHGPCDWSDGEPDLCTACENALADDLLSSLPPTLCARAQAGAAL